MTTQSLSQTEAQFAGLSAGDQLLLFERLARRVQLGDVPHDASTRRSPEMLVSPPKLPGEQERSELQSAAADLLSEAW